MVKQALLMLSRFTGYSDNLYSKDKLCPVFCLHEWQKVFVFRMLSL